MTCGYSAFLSPLLAVEVVSHQRVDDLGDVALFLHAADFQGFPVLMSQVDRGAPIKVCALGGEGIRHGDSGLRLLGWRVFTHRVGNAGSLGLRFAAPQYR